MFLGPSHATRARQDSDLLLPMSPTNSAGLSAQCSDPWHVVTPFSCSWSSPSPSDQSRQKPSSRELVKEGLSQGSSSEISSMGGSADLEDELGDPLHTKAWYPEDSMEVDAVLSQGGVGVWVKKSPTSGVSSARFAQVCDVEDAKKVEDLSCFLGENVPRFPFTRAVVVPVN
mmetsp:Transcript_7133/g.19555  ORF Transcript_7133/g.19555 Transcript_7133/m.19555 type:complete len:172 (-) Transcript_7133:148-663(-)